MNFKKWLIEDAGQVTQTYSNQGMQDRFSAKLRSKYIAGEPNKGELEDGLEDRDIDQEFLGKKRVPKLKYVPGKKYMKKDK
ncbi:MAG: hypothetical protein ACW99G_06975 [Candidatus Thorarchaeota archaeon]